MAGGVAAQGAEYDTAESMVVVTSIGGPIPVAPADQSRVALLVGNPSGIAGVFVSTVNDPAVSRGLPVPASGYLEITFHRHGPLCGQLWYGGTSAPSAPLVVITVRHREG